MATNTTTAPLIDVITFCANPLTFGDTCPGFCRNPELSNLTPFLSFIISVGISAAVMCWFTDVHLRRYLFHLQSLQVWSRLLPVAIAFWSGNSLNINSFDVLLTALLVTGAEAASLIGTAYPLRLVGYHSAVLLLEHALKIGVLIGVVYEAAKGGKGSQPHCTAHGILYWEPIFLVVALCIIFGAVLFFAIKPEYSPPRLACAWTLVGLILGWSCAVWVFWTKTQVYTLSTGGSMTALTTGQLLGIAISVTSIFPAIKHHAIDRLMRFWNVDTGKPYGETTNLRNTQDWNDTPMQPFTPSDGV